jgi:EF-P beta-lysylation protein EpmB
MIHEHRDKLATKSQLERQRVYATWQQALADIITNPKELFAELKLKPELIDAAYRATELFQLRVPRAFVARMRVGDPMDPLLLQVLPRDAEFQQVPGFEYHPLKEQAANPVPGLLHKYPGRALLIVTGSCAVNCRYCFRRHFPYEDNNPGTKGWEAALDYIAQDSSITEVIYSGGEPLLLKDQQLQDLTEKIAAISHVQRLRIHTRFPVVIPQRVTPELVSVLADTRLQTVVVLHANHANEIDIEVGRAMQKFRQANIVLLNQAVLLKNINDSVQAQVDLAEALFSVGILPYYLHVLDKVQGAAHFDVSEEQAKALILQMQKQLSGYLVPKLVKEQAGMLSKIAV